MYFKNLKMEIKNVRFITKCNRLNFFKFYDFTISIQILFSIILVVFLKKTQV